jgi:FlaA1/EpsC-like NDP-sugar epimerase
MTTLPSHPNRDFFSGKRVSVTGGGGSVGAELVTQLLRHRVELVRVVDNNETAIFHLIERFGGEKRLETFFCDIRDEHEINRTFSNMHVCFHAAALKHVPFCESSPFSAVQTNIIGAQQVIRAALRNGLSHVVFTSSDKAVNPTSVMGTSKLMGERLFTAANFLSEGTNRCMFTSTRFGNVAGSRGSVVPIFCEQIRHGRDVTLTDNRMTRFMMTLEQAARLVIDTMPLAVGGEIFITKMPVLSIEKLARVMIRTIAPLFDRPADQVKIRDIGARPGEKLWEELNSEEEVRRTFDLGCYLVVLPALRNSYARYSYGSSKREPITKTYHSSNEQQISESEIERFLLEPGVLPEDIRSRLPV